jgi:pyruvate dehydrogenase E2 component (dihydrolipoamide acetyltransferase)
MKKIKITPRAIRLARESGVDLESISITGTGFGGGVNEADVRKFLADRPAAGASSGATAGAATAASSGVPASPLARKAATAAGADLSKITGSGSHGKVMLADVLSAPAQAATQGAAQQAPAGAPLPATPEGKTVRETTPYSGVRKIIGDRLAHSKFTAPHLYFANKVNMEKLLALRAEVNSSREASGKKKTSVTDYVARAVVMALQKYPMMNASLVGEVIEVYDSVNLGIAVAAPGGLIVPVIKNSQARSLAQISEASAALVEKARAGKLIPDEYNGGTFTVSNLGMFDIENFTAIINPPESAILAIASIKDEAVVAVSHEGTKTVEIKPLMNMTLTVDHRIIDGLLAAQFIGEIKRILEHPVETLL